LGSGYRRATEPPKKRQRFQVSADAEKRVEHRPAGAPPRDRGRGFRRSRLARDREFQRRGLRGFHLAQAHSRWEGCAMTMKLPALAALAEHAAAPTDLTDERLETIARDIETTHTSAVLHIAAQLAEARDIFRYRRDEGGFGGWVETRLRYS